MSPEEHPAFATLGYDAQRLVRALVLGDERSESLELGAARDPRALAIAACCLGCERILVVVPYSAMLEEWQEAWDECVEPFHEHKSYIHPDHDAAIHGALFSAHVATAANVQRHFEDWERKRYDVVVLDGCDQLTNRFDPDTRRLWWLLPQGLGVQPETAAEHFVSSGFAPITGPGPRGRASAPAPFKAPQPPRLTVSADPLSALILARASLSSGPATVTFAVRRPGQAWQRLASDDSLPYRGFIEPARYRKGQRLEVVAIARSNGRLATSPVVSFRIP